MASCDDLYEEAARAHGSALDRLARAYEADPEARRDLLQEIHLALWRSFESFDARCSLRTWVYRVAHNVAASHVARDRRAKAQQLVSIDTVEVSDSKGDAESAVSRQIALQRLFELIYELKPIDRQVLLLFLEGFDAAGISDVTGVSAGNVATKIHRIKNVLTRRFETGGHHG
jgi:RNA polymerase sigma-70 factor (ECF subfamily)